MEKYILTLSCKDRRGIVARVTSLLAEKKGNIADSQQFGDESTGNFFLRIHFFFEEDGKIESFKEGFHSIAKSFDMQWKVQPDTYRPKVLIMVSKIGHCLNTLLNKQQMGTLAMDVAAVVSNHPDLKTMTENYHIPYYHMPKEEGQEERVLEMIEKKQAELVILARYMQILSPQFVSRLQGKIINIHHSFLPSFKGAKPYHQAYERGVKLIGATAHFVTENLDEGPIIEQEVVRVGHQTSIPELVTIGQDTEAITLARAVKWYLQQRVFINGTKTVVL